MVYTDHKNLTYKPFNTERVMRWRLILEEFGPELKDIKGENNVVADALSRLKISDNQDILNISKIYGYDDADLVDSAYPNRYHDIAKAHKTDDKLKQKLVSHKDFTLDTFCGGNQNHCLICQIYQNMLTRGIIEENCRLLSRDALSLGRDLHRLYSRSTFILERAFTQQYTTCVRGAQYAKYQKQLIRNMASCHLNSLKIPWTHYV